MQKITHQHQEQFVGKCANRNNHIHSQQSEPRIEEWLERDEDDDKIKIKLKSSFISCDQSSPLSSPTIIYDYHHY